MGLASAFSTALTGLSAAETQIDVIGNNLANSQTAGFKASHAIFATQFLQTLGLGSSPTASSGGTNPRQTGLGTQVAEITPDFTQGTIEVSSNPSDLAIQGNGFFMVQGNSGERLYTRNGQFKTNSENQLVTTTGNRLLGHSVDDQFQLQTSELVPLEIPLGAAAVAQATRNVTMEGTLTPVGDVASTAQVLESATLGDSAVPRPDSTTTAVVAPTPDATVVGVNHVDGGGSHAEGAAYRYRITFVDDSGTESLHSDTINTTVPAGNGAADNSIQLNNLPSSPDYAQVNIYRTAPGGSDFFLLDTVASGTASYTDDGSVPLSGTPLDSTTINGNYSYLVTYHRNGAEESRPSPLVGPQSVVNGRVQLSNFPAPPAPPPEGGFPAYDTVRIYRNLASDSSSYYLVGEVDPSESFTDNRTDAEISDLTDPNNKLIDMDGPKATSSTLLTNLVKRDELDFESMFQIGTLDFSGRKGGRALAEKSFQVTAASTLQDLIDFMEDSMGIQVAADDPQNPIPSSANELGTTSTAPLAPGGSVQEGRIRMVSNNGVDNSVSIGLSAFELTRPDGSIMTPSLGFGAVQEAEGQSAVADFLVYDTLGTALNVRVTAVLEQRTGTETTYRWFADSPSNDPLSGNDIAVGTGLITFDGEGNYITSTNNTVSIQRRNTPAASPLEFDFDFSNIVGLAAQSSSLAASRQDGSPPGTLTSFAIGEDGVVRGSFSNGVSRTLGQVRMARFANSAGLEQVGQNMFAEGANSGLPVEGNPGENGIGSVVAGAVELSNTDIGENLIDLVLATTQYRGNTRVVTAAQQLFDELLNLRR